jgi:hypothetical protein
VVGVLGVVWLTGFSGPAATYASDPFDAYVVPEPATISLLIVGMLLLGVVARLRRAKRPR